MLLRLVEKPPHLRLESLKATVQSPLQSLGKTFLLLGVALGVLPLQDLQLSHVSIFLFPLTHTSSSDVAPTSFILPAALTRRPKNRP
jgi:hypothetical protein